MPSEDATLLRLLDASLNRATEGARVVEDYARFVLNDRHLSGVAKEIRHELASIASGWPRGDRLACRDTPGDVGTEITTDSERSRPDAVAVCDASIERLQQALRSLEEYGKVLDPALGVRFEALRYRAYTLGKAIALTRRSRDRLAAAKLYVLIAGGSSVEGFERLVSSLCMAGVDVLQLRDKQLSDGDLLDRARRLAAVARGHGVISIVNDRPDIAAAAGTNGVHVGQEELPVAAVRRIVGPEAVIGVSTHSIEQARQAVLDGAGYLGVGPTFPTPTKDFDAFPGLDFVREVAQEIALPAFAIGGIGEANVQAVLDAGLSRIAVSSAISGSPDPPAAVEQLKRLLGPVGEEVAAG